jgi:hypothetical protein
MQGCAYVKCDNQPNVSGDGEAQSILLRVFFEDYMPVGLICGIKEIANKEGIKEYCTTVVPIESILSNLTVKFGLDLTFSTH